MLCDPQSSAHRAQPPTRIKTRWQPYPHQTSGSAVATDMNTPKPSVPPSPLPSVNPLPTSNNYPPQLPKDLIQRDSGKQKYALGLIDQAVKTLSEIWRPEDIPCVFILPAKGPPLCSSKSSPAVLGPQTTFQSLVSTGAETDSALLPLKNFVHEVLKRSRTSGSAMQTALCYLEAIRSKVPQILRDEKLGIRSYFLPESAILPATEAELQLDRNLEDPHPSMSDELVKTVRVTDEDADVLSDQCEASSIAPESTTTHAIPLPSPLLCPRRTFLAALILAAKFSQDKCYSNRAWAKLSGLPPREIGRCERALGQALDWRLWVGKKAKDGVASSVVASAPGGPSRTVVRTQSEGCVSITPSLREPFLGPSEPKLTCPNLEAPFVSTGKGLRRCSTVPTESFACSRLPQKGSGSLVNEESRKNTCWEQVPQSSSGSSSGSSTSSPETPPLSYSPSTSGDRTIQISSYEDVFPSGSQPRLDLEVTSSVYSASPSSFLADSTDSKLCAPLREEKFTTMHLQMSLAETISETLWGSRLSMIAGSHLWHADGGHLSSLESASVH